MKRALNYIGLITALFLLVAVVSVCSIPEIEPEPRDQCVIFKTGTWYNINQVQEINNYSTSNNLSYKKIDCYDLRYYK